MNENVSKFFETVAANPELAEKVKAISAETSPEAAEKISALAADNGTPFTAEELLSGIPQNPDEVSEEQLDGVAGGVEAPQYSIIRSD